MQVVAKVVQQAQLLRRAEATGDTPPQRPPFGADLAVFAVLHTGLELRP